MPFHVCQAVAAHFGWRLDSFDVEVALLTGQTMQREVYFKPPKDGVHGLPVGCLIRAVKSVLGVPKAPRLWLLELIDVALKCQRESVLAFPCVLALRAAGRFVGLLCDHVDDGSMTGDDGLVNTKSQEDLCRRLRMKQTNRDDFDLL